MSNDPQVPLFVDDLYSAIRATCDALGGLKVVGDMLRPEKNDPAEAGRWLGDCLNPDRRERLDLEQLAMIRRKARAAGCHILAAWEAKDAGYAPPQPIAPEDEAAQLQREFIASVRALQAIQQKMARNGMQAVG